VLDAAPRGEDVPAAETTARPLAGRGIAWHLAVLCLAIIVPVLALAGALATFYASAERERLAQAALRTAEAATLALDRDLAGLIAATEVLSLSTELRAGDLDAFDIEARRVRDRLGVNVVMRDRASRQVVNTRLPRGAPLPRNPDFASDRRVLETGRPDVSDLIAGAVTRAPLFIVNVPVFRDGAVEYLLNLSLPPERVREAVQAGSAAPGWTITVLDRNGTVVADTAQHESALGQRLEGEAWWRDGPGEGVRRLRLPWDDRGPLLAAHARSSLSGWTVMVGVPVSQANAPLRRSLAGLGMLAVALVGLSAGLAVIFGRRIARPVAELARGARRLGQGEDVAPSFTGLREVDAAGRALALASAERRRREAALRETNARLRLALDAAGFGHWEVDLRTGLMLRAGRVVPARPGLGLEGYLLDEFLQRVVHPDDIAGVRGSFDALAAGRSDRHRVEYRVRTPDDAGWLWMESYGGVVERDPATGVPVRVTGVSRDVTDLKAEEAQRKILLREVDHRAKNALAVAQSVVALTRADDPAQYAKAVNGRIGALARAHMRLAAGGWTGTDLRALLTDELLPFGLVAAADGPPGQDERRPRIALSGGTVELSGEAAAPVAMLVHELATNAAKHGALSVEAGSVRVAWALDEAGTLRLSWTERDGPRIGGRPSARGFGSRMLDATVRHQLGGWLCFDWAPGGLRCEMGLPLRGQPVHPGDEPGKPRP
jgi:two-component sensor histidine kinase